MQYSKAFGDFLCTYFLNLRTNAQPPGTVMLSSWMVGKGYSHDLQQRYKKSHWLKSIGTGAFARTNDKVGYEGAIYAMQGQGGLTVHPGGRTALSLLGKAHYLELSASQVVLFGGGGEELPTWFRKNDWGVQIDYHATSFLPDELGLTEVELSNFSIKVSGVDLGKGKRSIVKKVNCKFPPIARTVRSPKRKIKT
ncbi:MAG: type IV toxin-antitoxin system AbiEi family antitoxin [Chitinophagaceae bacterium]|nr:type IV toxin-antitoxin system AbiEi family antitoxin [Chitinophagaceae bacterium]